MRQGRDSHFLRLIGRLAAETKNVDAATLTELVQQIAPMLPGLCGTFSKLAVLAGALVERGASPLALADVLPERAVATMARYLALEQVWPTAGDGRALPEFSPPLDEAVLNDIESTLVAHARQHGKPEQIALLIAYSWFSVNDWINPLIAAMTSSHEFRAAMDRREQVLEGATALAKRLPRAHWLRGLCLVRDDEPLIVLDPSTGRGFRLTMSGVGDNYQLHTLLADRLMGRGRGALLSARRAATTGPTGPFDYSKPITRRFRLFDGHGGYVYPEGWPADIEPLDGMRVLVLHPPNGHYGWKNGRAYVGGAHPDTRPRDRTDGSSPLALAHRARRGNRRHESQQQPTSADTQSRRLLVRRSSRGQRRKVVDQDGDPGGAVGRRQAATAFERDQAVERGPEGFGVRAGFGFRHQRAEREEELVEAVLQRLGAVRAGEGQFGGEGEHRVVQRGLLVGEPEVGLGDPDQRPAQVAGFDPGPVQVVRELGEALEGRGRHDRLLAAEVAVEDRLAVLDRRRQPARGHRVPALGLRELPGRGDDQPLALGAFAFPAG
jgi:hypothetical protein